MMLYTIGHSNHSFERFVQLLEENHIGLVVDVRSAPYSRYNPGFNREVLETALRGRYIEYVYAGKYLGGRPTDPTCYKDRLLPPDEGVDYLHKVDYPEVMKRDWFRRGIQRLLEIADEQVGVIMCSEEDPAKCHRHHLIARYLMAERPKVDIRHIRGDGNVIRASSILSSVNEPKAEQTRMPF
jgi:uncharacterized protein (DUF488 family)